MRTLEEAWEYVDVNRIDASEKPAFHLTPPVGWMNDPNGFSVYDGEVHVFYQFHPYSTEWGPMHWGHAVSKDMVTFVECPVALAPDMDYDCDGCFSGSAIEDGPNHIIVYTGVSNGRQNQCVAAGDGKAYSKLAENPVINGDMLPEGFSRVDFRDPKMWRDEDCYYLVAVNADINNKGQILLFRTSNLIDWQYVKVLEAHNADIGEMWECPDFFEVSGRHVLMFSAMDMSARGLEFHNGNNCVYTIGDFDRATYDYRHGDYFSLDYGLDYYAPQTTCLPDGRRVLIGWLQSWHSIHRPASQRYCGMMTIMRELTIEGGKLIQKPISELTNYRVDRVELRNQKISGTKRLEGISGRFIDMEITVKNSDFSRLIIQLAVDDQHHTDMCYYPSKQVIFYDRTYSGIQRDVACTRNFSVKSDKKELKLRIIMDRNSVEIFANGGEQVFSAQMYTPISADAIVFHCDSTAVVDITKWNIDMENKNEH